MNRNYKLSPKISRLLLIIYCLIIFSISTVSHPTRDLGLQKGTKPHLLEYSGLGLLSFIYFLTKKNKTIKSAMFAIAFSILFAISDEIHQHFTPSRECDIWDVITDSIGSSLAIFISAIFLLYTKTTINQQETSDKINISSKSDKKTN